MPIFKQQLLRRLYQEENSGQPPAGGAPTVTPEMQALIDAAVATQVNGLKNKNNELLGKVKDLGENLKKFEGIDPELTRSILKRFADDDEAKLIAEGKIDEVLNKRVERMRVDYDKKLNDATTAAEQASKRAAAYQGRVLDDAIRAAAAKAGVHQHAIDDALMQGRVTFALDDDGQAVALGADGRAVLGKDGKSPLTPTEWLEGMKESKPHWFPASSAGGGAGGSRNGGSVSNKKAQDMSAGEKSAYIAANGLDGWTKKVHADYAK